jgi:cystathionine beta-lyase
MQRDTRLVHVARDPARDGGAVNPPVHRASTIIFPSLRDFATRAERRYTSYSYGLQGTLTSIALAEAVADLSGGHRSVIVSSGLAAVTHAMTAFLRAGDHVLLADSVYGPTRAFGASVLARFGVDVEFYDPLIGGGIRRLLRERTRIVYTESPGTATFEVQDVPAIAGAAHAAGTLVVLDNTWATPLNFRAFDHGVDIEVQAGTKYLAGHSDLLVGTITVRTEAHYRAVRDDVIGFGDHASPDVCYETLRGLRTLAVRMRQLEASTLAVARWLADRPEVARVLHPALPGHPGHDVWKRDFLGSSSLFGVLLRTDSMDAVGRMVDGFRLFKIGASFGGYESLVTLPAPERTARPWTERGALLRFHVGLEAVDDLIADLKDGLERLA